MNKKFLIQTIKGKVVHDFAFTLERALEYQTWRGEKFETEYAAAARDRKSAEKNVIIKCDCAFKCPKQFYKTN